MPAPLDTQDENERHQKDWAYKIFYLRRGGVLCLHVISYCIFTRDFITMNGEKWNMYYFFELLNVYSVTLTEVKCVILIYNYCVHCK